MSSMRRLGVLGVAALFCWAAGARAQPLVLESVTPAAAAAGSAGIAITVTGTGFVSELEPLIELRWDSLDQPLPTSRSSGRTLTAEIPGELLDEPGEHRIFAVRACAEAGCQTFTLSNPLTFTVEAEPRLQATPERLGFTYSPGGPAPSPLQVTVSGSGIASFSVEIATAGGGDWLSATPASGALPATIQVAVDPAGLGAGVYRGSVLLVPAGGGSAEAVAVTLTVGSEPNLTFSPPKLEFGIVDGQPQPASIEVAVSGQAGLAFEVVGAPTWIDVQPLAATVPTTLTVRILPEALPAGDRTALITFVAEGLASPRILEATVRTGGPPRLSVSPASLSFALTRGERPPPQTLSLSAATAGTPFTITSSQSWLEATPLSGQTPATITVQIEPQLEPGEHAAELLISSGGSETLRVAVTARVEAAPPPSLELSGLGSEFRPAEQPRIRVTLNTAAAAPVEGVLRAEFTPEAPVPAGTDPLVTFVNGSTETPFRIATGGTAVEFALQTGTTAGVLRLSASTADGQSTAELTSRLPVLPPVIQQARLEAAGDSLQLTVIGYATSRDIDRARLAFEAAPGADLDTPPAEVTGAADAFESWFARPESRVHGGAFRLAVPLSVSGDPAALAAVVITLGNAQGESSQARAPR